MGNTDAEDTIERPDQVEHHRWFPPEQRQRGLAPLDGPTRAMLHELRWRKPPRDHRRLWLALCIALLLHVLFAIIVSYQMKPRLRLSAPTMQPPADQALQIRFIARTPARVAAPPPLVPPPPPHPAREAASRQAMTVHMPAAASPAPPPPASASPPMRPLLFDRTGQVVVPATASTAPAAPAAQYVQRAPQGDTQIMQNHAGAQYQSAPNRFNRYFPPPRESFVAGVMRKLNGRESNSRSVDLPGGTHLQCQKVMGIPIPNCGEPPPPPPPTDGDQRLNMAPAPLVKGTPLPKPDVAACIADYRAGKPLPHGCPVDTPARAVDAEKKPPIRP